MKDMWKDKPRAKKIEEMLSLKASRGVSRQEGCHTWRGK